MIFSIFAIFYYLRSDTSPSSLGSNPSFSELVEFDKSIAVLPLEYMCPDPDNAFFADGVQDDILTNLSRIDELRIISRSSTIQYRNPDRNLKQAVKELGLRRG
ncbi:MAG: hypothetical protein O7C75_16735 [Verrucomicrobia bacterium]|nr:hypothetical protein [Verrucomicrobiota bacterium]